MPAADTPGPAFASESLLCACPDRNRMIASSRDHGWGSLLLDYQEGRGGVEPYDKTITPDLCVTGALSGSYSLALLRRGRWCMAEHRAGTIGVTRGGEGDRLRWQVAKPDDRFTVASAYLPGALLAEAADHFRRPGLPSLVEPTSELLLVEPLVAAVMRGLVRSCGDEGGEIYADQAARWLASHLVWINRGRYREAAEERCAGLIDDRRLARVVEYVTANLASPLDLATLAGVAGVSPFHFTRLFRRAAGLTPQRFVTQCRMRNARRLILQTDLQISEVARRCGFSRASSFIAAFSRTYGAAPTSLRADRDIS